MPDEPRFVQDEGNDPGKAESWTLDQGDVKITLGWRKGSRWIAIITDDGETQLVQLSGAQMHQLGEIAREI